MPAHERPCVLFTVVLRALPSPGQHAGVHMKGFLSCTPSLKCMSLKMYIWKHDFTTQYSLIMKAVRFSSLPAICLFDKSRGREEGMCPSLGENSV